MTSITNESGHNNEAKRARIAEIRRSQRMLEPDIASPRVAEDLRVLNLELHELLDQLNEPETEPQTRWSPKAAETHANLDRLRRQ